MGKIKRKQKQRKIVRRHNPQDAMAKLTDEQLSTIPPHLLDKIPSSMSLKPNAQTMRSMLMQRLAPPYVQMPLMSPQQQQAQTLKNSNDIREQSLNQDKQNLIIQKDRQASLQREEANVKIEQQQLKQHAQYEKEKQNIKLKKQKVDFDKQLTSEDGEIMKKKREAENLEALVQQAKFENERAKKQIENDEYANKIKSLTKELGVITSENKGLLTALDKMTTENQLADIAKLTENIVKTRAHNMVLMRLHEMHNQILDNELKSKCQIPVEMLNEQIEVMGDKIIEFQQVLAQHRIAQMDYDMTLNRHKFYEKTMNDILIQTEEQDVENLRKQEEIKSFDSPTKKEKIKTLNKEQAKKKVEGELLDTEMKVKSDIQDKQSKIDENKAKDEYMQSEEYRNKLHDIESNKKARAQLEEKEKLAEETTEAHKNFAKQSARAEVSETVKNAVLNDENVVDALKTSYSQNTGTTYKDKIKDEQIFSAAAAQQQTANMENEETTKYLKAFQEVYNSPGVHRNTLIEFLEKEQLTYESLAELPLHSLKEIYGRFQTLLSSRMQQANAAISQDF